MFELPQLPYAMNALEPVLSQETLQYHYGKHHKAYVDNLNGLLPNSNFEGKSLEAIVMEAPMGPLFNNAAQVWNHTFYWHCLSPEKNQQPSGALAQAIDKAFGSFAQFKEQFSKTALTTFGSGWAWLVKNSDGSLAITSTSNAQSPVRDGHLPLLTCDVWEHAYYIDYRNARAQYIEAFWQLVNWKFVSEQFQK